jgi:hypothetical protein
MHDRKESSQAFCRKLNLTTTNTVLNRYAYKKAQAVGFVQCNFVTLASLNSTVSASPSYAQHVWNIGRRGQ